MIVLASSGPEAAAALGINSWWNQEAPGKNQAKMAGDMVETAWRHRMSYEQEMNDTYIPGSMYKKSAW
jgi:hypothetical protein